MLLSFSASRFIADPTRVVPLLSLILGLIALFIAPVLGKVPDEASHFFRSYGVSQLHVFSEKQDNMLGGYIPRNLNRLTSPLLHTSLRPEDRIFVRYDGAAVYSPVSYIPQAIGIMLGRLAHAPPVVIFYLARLCNLLAWVALIWAAVKVAPKWGWAIGAIALLPICIFQSATVSADAVTIGLSIFYVAQLVRAATTAEPIGRFEYGLLFITSVLLALTKPPLFLMALGVLAIPMRRFKNFRSTTLAVSALIVPAAVAAVGWNLLVHEVDVTQGFVEANPARQEQEMLSHPWVFAGAAFNIHFVSPRSSILLESAVNPDLWLGVPMILWVIMLSFGLVLYGFFEASQHGTVLAQGRQRLVFLATAAIMAVATDAILYIYFTPVNANLLNGLQGRYFIPMILLLPFVLKNERLKIQASPTTTALVISVGSIITFTVMVLAILHIYPLHFNYIAR